MFSKRSRYAKALTRVVSLADGRQVTLVDPPMRASQPLAGYHKRSDEQRLDQIAAVYLGDPTGYWRLCDAADGATPDALAARPLVGVPRPGG